MHAPRGTRVRTNNLGKKLQIYLNKTVRVIKNLGSRSHIGFSELNSLNLLNVEFRVKQLRQSHVHTIVNGTGPSYLSEHFIKASDIHYHFTRGSTGNFIVPSVRGIAATTFYYMGIFTLGCQTKVHIHWFQICCKTIP